MARSIFELVFRAIDNGASATVAGLQSALGAMPGAAQQAGAAVQTAVGRTGAAASQATHAAQHAASAALSSVQQAATQTGAAVQGAANAAGQAAESMTAKFAKLVAAVGAMGFLKASVDEFATFDDAMLKVQALSKATGAEFDALKAKAAELGASTKFTASEAAAGMSQLAAAGYNTAQILDAIGPAMYAAAAGGSDLGETADQLTNIMGAFGLEADQAGRVADVLTQGFTGAATTMSELAYAMKPAGAIAKALGYSLEETVSVLQSLANVGYKGEQAGTALRGALSRLLNPTGEVSKKLKEFNIQVKDQDGKIRKFADIIEDLGKSGVEAADMLTIFGDEAGPAMQALLGQGADAIRAYERSLLSAAGRAQEVSDHMESGLGGALRRLDAAWSAVKNSFGEAIAPAIRQIADALALVAGWFAKMPDWAKQALALAAVFATAAGAYGAAKGVIVAACTQIGVAVVGMAGKIQAAFAFMLANPWVAALTVALGAAVAAYKYFGKSAMDAAGEHEDASKAHARAAEEIGKGIEATKKQADELRALQKTLLESKQGTDEHRDAEEKLARVLPEANTRLDEQGRILATVTDATDENNKALTRLIESKEHEAQMQAAQQMEAQARAYYSAGKAVDEYTEYTRRWYGYGEKMLTVQQQNRLEMDRQDGTLDKHLAKGAEYRTNLEKQKKAWEDLLRTWAKGGTSLTQVHELLNRNHLDADTKGRIIRDYRAMLSEVNRETERSAKESAEGVQKATGEALEGLVKQYKKYAEEIRAIQDQINGRQKSLAAELRDMGRSGMSDADAWADQKKEAEEYVAAAKRAAEEARAAFASGDTITATARWKEAVQLADDAKSAYRALNKEVKDGDQVVVSKADALEQAMAGVKEAGELGIGILKEQQDETYKAMDALEEKSGFAALYTHLDEAEQKWLESWQNMQTAGKEAVEAVSVEFDIVAKQATIVEEHWAIAALKTKQMWVEVSDELRRRLDEACKPRTVTVYTAEVVKRAAGGIVSAFRRGGRLPGYGGGDRISALLEAGEFVIRKEAVAKFGAGFFDALNSLRLPDFSGLIPQPALAAAAPAAPSRTVNINLTLPSGDTYQLSADPATADRIEREQARWWSLRSSNRVRRPGIGRTP